MYCRGRRCEQICEEGRGIGRAPKVRQILLGLSGSGGWDCAQWSVLNEISLATPIRARKAGLGKPASESAGKRYLLNGSINKEVALNFLYHRLKYSSCVIEGSDCPFVIRSYLLPNWANRGACLLTYPQPPSDAVRQQEKNIIEDLFSSVVSQFKNYHPSGNLKFNYLGIFLSLKLCILIEKTLSISLKQNFTRNTSGC